MLYHFQSSPILFPFYLMNRSKFVAILTGAISLLLAIAYLIMVQLLDFRGEMVPAPPLSSQYAPSIAILDIS